MSFPFISPFLRAFPSFSRIFRHSGESRNPEEFLLEERCLARKSRFPFPLSLQGKGEKARRLVR